MPPDSAPTRLEHGDDRDNAENEVPLVRVVHAIDHSLEVEEDVRGDRDSGGHERQIDNVDALDEARVHGIEQEGQDQDRGQEDHHVDLGRRDGLSEQADRGDEHDAGEGNLGAGRGVIEREQGRGDGQNGHDAVPPAGERPRPRLGLVLLDELLGLVVGKHGLEVRSRDDLRL